MSKYRIKSNARTKNGNQCFDRKKELQEKILEDENEIKKYAKKLKLNKRKRQTFPKSFENDGLAYLLEICDPERRISALENEDFNDEEFHRSDEDSEPETLPIKKKKTVPYDKLKPDANPHKTISTKRVHFSVDRKSFSASDDENDDFDSSSDVESEPEKSKNEVKEDIYGRLRDSKGNVIKEKPQAKLINDNEETVNDSSNETVRKNMRSIINRLGEGNAFASAVKIGELYTNFGRNTVKALLTDSIFQSIIRQEKVPDRLILEQCLLLAIIHSKVSSEITSYLVEKLALKLMDLDKKDKIIEFESNKVLENVSLLFSYLYLLKVIQKTIIFDILKLYAREINEKSVELILTILQSIGSTLRKDDPFELKIFMEDVASRSVEVDTSNGGSRVKFMLETLRSIKNNNFLKVANCDLELNEHFLKLLRSSFPGKPLETPLPMNLAALWSASENGRWWIVGSAVTVPSAAHGRTETEADSSSSAPNQSTHGQKFSEKLLKLAKKNHMNTDVRRNIFCLLMSSEDYLDAFEKLNKCSYNSQQEREIVYIALNCCLKEKTYNPFYVYLIQRFCLYRPRFVLTTQFVVWDTIKQLNTKSVCAIENLSSCLTHLISNKALSLAVLKVIDFGTMDKYVRMFLKHFFTNFLLRISDETLKVTLSNCINQKKNETFLEGVKAFLHYYLLKEGEIDEKHLTIIRNKVALIDNFLYFNGNDSLL